MADTFAYSFRCQPATYFVHHLVDCLSERGGSKKKGRGSWQAGSGGSGADARGVLRISYTSFGRMGVCKMPWWFSISPYQSISEGASPDKTLGSQSVAIRWLALLCMSWLSRRNPLSLSQGIFAAV